MKNCCLITPKPHLFLFLLIAFMPCFVEIAHAQDKWNRSLFLETGRENQLFKNNDNHGVMKVPDINRNFLIRIGMEYEKNKLIQTASLDYRTYNITTTVWQPPTPIQTGYGYHIGGITSFAYTLEQTVIGSTTSVFFLRVGIGIKAGLVNRGTILNPSPYSGDSIEIVQDLHFYEDGTLAFSSVSVLSRSSPFFLGVQAHLVPGFNITERLAVSVIPHFSPGLITFFQNDYYYNDFARNLQGSGSLTSKGTSYGIRVRIAYNIDPEHKKN